MTNSQKAFEEMWKNDKRFNFMAPTGMAKMFWQLAWDARGKFDEEICDSLEVWEDHSNEIRKRGGE